MSNKINLEEVVSKVDVLLSEIQTIKDGSVKKVYNTKKLCKYLGVGRSVVDKLRQNGEITYSKVGQSFVFTQQDVDDYLMRNQVKYVGWLMYY